PDQPTLPGHDEGGRHLLRILVGGIQCLLDLRRIELAWQPCVRQLVAHWPWLSGWVGQTGFHVERSKADRARADRQGHASLTTEISGRSLRPVWQADIHRLAATIDHRLADLGAFGIRADEE